MDIVRAFLVALLALANTQPAVTAHRELEKPGYGYNCIQNCPGRPNG